MDFHLPLGVALSFQSRIPGLETGFPISGSGSKKSRQGAGFTASGILM